MRETNRPTLNELHDPDPTVPVPVVQSTRDHPTCPGPAPMLAASPHHLDATTLPRWKSHSTSPLRTRSEVHQQKTSNGDRRPSISSCVPAVKSQDLGWIENESGQSSAHNSAVADGTTIPPTLGGAPMTTATDGPASRITRFWSDTISVSRGCWSEGRLFRLRSSGFGLRLIGRGCYTGASLVTSVYLDNQPTANPRCDRRSTGPPSRPSRGGRGDRHAQKPLPSGSSAFS